MFLIGVVTFRSYPVRAPLFLYVPRLDINLPSILPTDCIYGFRMILRIKSDDLLKQQ